MTLYEKTKKIKIEKICDDRFLLVAYLDFEEEYVEIQVILNYPILEILDIQARQITRNHDKDDKCIFNLNRFIGESMSKDYFSIINSDETLEKYPLLQEMLSEIHNSIIYFKDSRCSEYGCE